MQLCLLPEDSGQRVYNLRDVFDALRSIVRTGSPLALPAQGLPPRRWSISGAAADCFEAVVHDLRAVLWFAVGEEPEPTAAIFDGRTIQSTPESGYRAGYDGRKRRKGSKVHMAADTLGHLLAAEARQPPQSSAPPRDDRLHAECFAGYCGGAGGSKQEYRETGRNGLQNEAAVASRRGCRRLFPAQQTENRVVQSAGRQFSSLAQRS